MRTEDFQVYKLGLEKAEKSEVKLPNICWIMEKAREFWNNIYFCFTDYSKVFDCVDHNKLENSSRDGYILLTLPTSWETCMQIKKQ